MTSGHRYHWVIGDVHGCHNSLATLLDVLPKSDHLVFCGDIINRGSDIEATMTLAWALVEEGRATWLRGNHEQRLIDTLDSKTIEKRSELLHNDTYQQLGEALTLKWIARLKKLPFCYQREGWTATHAGFNSLGAPDLRVRETFWENYDGRFGRVIVGHTPRPEIERHQHIVMIDTGACYGGFLTAYCPETDAVVQVLGEEQQPMHVNLKKTHKPLLC